MDFEMELKKRLLTIKECSIRSGIPYATLYPIIKGQTDIGNCSYYTVKKLARTLGYSTDEIVDHEYDFNTFRKRLRKDIQKDDLMTMLEILNDESIEKSFMEGDSIKGFYLLATVDLVRKKYGMPLCTKFNEIRKRKLKKSFHTCDRSIRRGRPYLEEFAQYGIVEYDLYDAD